MDLSETEPRAGWKVVEARSIAGDDIRALMAGKVACIHVSQFLPPAWCDRVAERFLALPSPPVRRVSQDGAQTHLHLGTMLSSEPVDEEAYFNSSGEMAGVLRRLYEGGDDPIDRIAAQLAAAMGWKEAAPKEGGRPYHRSMVGGMLPGASIPLHFDSPRCLESSTDLQIGRYPDLLNLNVYLSAPERGGALRFYHRRGRPKDKAPMGEKPRAGADPVQGAPCVELPLKTGDLVILEPNYYHEVTKIEGERPRISCHSQVGVNAPAREMFFWI